jgi:signal transduction histidine kinase
MYGVRREMTGRLFRQADAQVASAVEDFKAKVTQQAELTGRMVRSFAGTLAGDNRFRLAVLTNSEVDRSWLRDMGPPVMRGAGYTVFQLQDSTGRVLTSGHFRNQFDQVTVLPPFASGESFVLQAATPDTTVVALATLDTFRVGDRLFYLTAGRTLDSARLAELSASTTVRPALRLGTGDVSASDVAGVVPLPYVDLSSGNAATDSAAIVLTRDTGPIEALRKSVDRWFLFALAITLLVAIMLATWLSSRLSRPLAELAEKTSRVDLDRLDQDFPTERDDELGTLSRLLDAMTRRLRSSAMRIREAERRAAVGDLARQINHDVKNGLAPIRHVLRHLGQVAEREPANLATIFKERAATLDSSIEYLDTLARNYARLSPALDRSQSDVNLVLKEIAQAIPVGSVAVETRFAESLPQVAADQIVLRRIFENLVMNGLEAMDGDNGRLSMSSEFDSASSRVRVSIMDSGRGMSREELERAFDDFYTTKSSGTGLGLSVVRRLVSDLGGTLRVETAPGQGSRFIVELPAAPGAR